MELPEHDKLKMVQHLSQACYDFIEWCGERGISLAERDMTTPHQNLYPEHFDVDLKRLEREKVAILDEQRALNSRVAAQSHCEYPHAKND